MAEDLRIVVNREAGTLEKTDEASHFSSICPQKENNESFSLKNFVILNILQECSRTKTLVVEGKFSGDDSPAILIVEKLPFDARDLPQIFSYESRLELKFKNDIYANYSVYPESLFNGIGVRVIHPPAESDFSKFINHPQVMVTETKEIYDRVVCPHFTTIASTQVTVSSTNLICEETSEDATLKLHKLEIEKCSCSAVHFYVKVIVEKKGLLSLRDLKKSDISLLQHLQKICLGKLSILYEVPSSKIESYVLYPPTSFPFYVVFETVEKHKSIPAEKAHSLQTVINNLQLIPDYYQKIALPYSLSDNDPLLQKINEFNDNRH